MPENEENEIQQPKDDPNKVLRQSLPPNSKKSQAKQPEPKKKLEKVIEGEAVVQKPTIGKRIRMAFTGDDARSVFDYLLFEVALPALKTTISDMTSQGIDRMLFGDASRRPGPGNRRPGRVDYNVISRTSGTRYDRDEPRVVSARDRASHNFDNIVLATRPEAELVLQTLMEAIDQYSMVTVSDLYDLVGITGNFTDDKWGWYELNGADIVRVRDGFIIDLPPTKPLK
jgi:hypothetical protein